MPPKSNSTNGFVKPLMVLKQNVTKPLIENIEIDVPEKGVKLASKPSVEVIEGEHKEMMKVTKGQVVVENAAQKSDTNSEGKNFNLVPRVSLLPIPWGGEGGKMRDPVNEAVIVYPI